MGRLRLTFLGTGTSMGVPTLGCPCNVCHSSDPRDHRTRPSVLLEYNGRAIVIDTSPDFRHQALRAGLERVDAVLYTHGHADHILGLDDLRPYNLKQGAIPLYANAATQDIIRQTFAFAFGRATPNSTVPLIELRPIDSPWELFGLRFVPLPVQHGEMEVLGFRFGRAAYVTDFSAIPPASLEQLRGLDLLVLDALRHRPHPNHSSVEQSLRLVEELRPRRAYFTHIAHDLSHAETNAQFPPGVELAYDGLVAEVEG
ncbi:MAG: MBL fold metallo-hydrolase [Acidobacteria bacterium]|nr:MBL fold metallo-hydrolase [Acidobacteriota bacterium]